MTSFFIAINLAFVFHAAYPATYSDARRHDGASPLAPQRSPAFVPTPDLQDARTPTALHLRSDWEKKGRGLRGGGALGRGTTPGAFLASPPDSAPEADGNESLASPETQSQADAGGNESLASPQTDSKTEADVDQSFYLRDGELLGLDSSFPGYRESAAEARFVVMKYNGIAHLKALPVRQNDRPYIIWFHGLQLDHCVVGADVILEERETQGKVQYKRKTEDMPHVWMHDKFEKKHYPFMAYIHKPFNELGDKDPECEFLSYAKTRADVIWVNHDLADHVLSSNDAKYRMRGITVPSPNIIHTDGVWNAAERRYFLTFRGTYHYGWFRSSSARPDLLKAFHESSRPGIVVETVDEGECCTKADRRKFKEYLDSTYGLVPHGDGRWNYRLNDIVGVCSIPVIVADGLELPFSALIDWSKASVVIPEEYASNATRVLEFLTTDETQLDSMQRSACDIHRMHFRTWPDRGRALLRSAVIMAE